MLAVVGAWRSTVDWADAQPRRLGAYVGWVTVVGDPVPVGSALRVTIEIEGERFDCWTYGSARRRLADRQSGDRVLVAGRRLAVTAGLHRAQIRHVVGRFAVDVVGDWRDGNRVARTAARVRAALRRSAELAMNDDDAALFTGLVIGDDARQSPAMVAAFRGSGLSHLTAVSGENLAFVIAAASPMLRRLRPWWRWLATLLLIGWFMMLTRFEPSVLRAGVMAALACSAVMFGAEVSALRRLSLAVTTLTLIDPILVWSVGFWLSVGATAGVCVVAPRLAAVLPGPIWVRSPVSITLGAQLGVALPSVLVFHRLPLVSVPANLLAVPVAGFVMLAGIPAGLAAAAAPFLTPLLMAPCSVATRWVETVAVAAARLEPPALVTICGWTVIALVVCTFAVRHRRSVCQSEVTWPFT
jgi:competence protein ComEC